VTNNTIISCQIDTTDASAALGLEVWVDNQKFFDTDHVQTTEKISIELSNDESDHELRFVMKNKTAGHTQFNESGDVIADASLIISDLAFDKIQLGNIVTEQAVYTHNFNGSQSEIKDKFHSVMGCNGTISLKFSTPVYLWLLEYR
jgi:hypothetical protein